MASLFEDDVFPLLEGPAMKTIFTSDLLSYILFAISAYFLSWSASQRFTSSVILECLTTSLRVPTPCIPISAHQSECDFKAVAIFDCLFIFSTLSLCPSIGYCRQNPALNPHRSKVVRQPVDGTSGP